MRALDWNNRTAGEQDFIHQQTKHLTVVWANRQLQSEAECLLPTEALTHGITFKFLPHEALFVEYARTKGWISKVKDALTAAGFKQAAAVLKK